MMLINILVVTHNQRHSWPQL